MFENLKAPDNVLAMHFSGELTADDIKQYQSLFQGKIKAGTTLGAVIDFTGLSDMSAKALESGAQADMAFLEHIGQFPRMALVSDKQWPAIVVGLVKFVMPGTETKVFPSAQQDKAIQWAAEAPAAPQRGGTAGGGISKIQTDQEDVYAFEIDGVLSGDSVEKFSDDANAFFANHEEVRMLGRIKNFAGFDLGMVLQSGLLSMKLNAIRKVGKYAVVGAPGWMQKVVAAVAPIMPGMEIKAFAAENENEAWQWIGAKPKD